MQGVDVSQLNGDSRTGLHIACCDGDIKLVRALLEMGANVHIKDRFDRTPLTEAVENDHHEVKILFLFYELIKLLMEIFFYR